MGDIGDWYRSIPQMTRYWFTGSVVLPLAGKIGLVTPMSMILTYDVIKRFHIWRPITALFYYPLMPQTGFHYLINLYFLYSYSSRLETGLFDGKPADYLMQLIFQWATLVVIGLLFNLMLLMDPMIIAVLYVWCQINRDTIVQFWFGTQFKAMYLPWVLCAFNMILMGGGFSELIGIMVGHLYFFIKFKLPHDFGRPDILQTPQFLYSYFPSRRNISGFGVPPASQRPAGGAADRPTFGGVGRRLGDD